MADLHERITAKLDDREALALGAHDATGSAWGVPYMLADGYIVETGDDKPYIVAERMTEEVATLIAAVASPDVVLRAVAEDRGVLARHGRCAPGCGVHFVFPAVPWTPWLCCKCGTAFAYCPEVLSLARRHGIDTGEP